MKKTASKVYVAYLAAVSNIIASILFTYAIVKRASVVQGEGSVTNASYISPVTLVAIILGTVALVLWLVFVVMAYAGTGKDKTATVHKTDEV